MKQTRDHVSTFADVRFQLVLLYCVRKKQHIFNNNFHLKGDCSAFI